MIISKIFEISSASFDDQVNIIANFLTIINKIEDTEETLAARNYPDYMISEVKNKINIKQTKSCGILFKIPLTKFKYPLIGYLLTITENYERGILPFNGSLSDQPSQVIELINIVQLVKIEHQNEVQREQSKKINYVKR